MLMAGSLGISTGYGMLLLLPLYVLELGGDEANFGLTMATATVPAAVAIGLLVRFPDRIRPPRLLAAAIAAYGAGAVGVALTHSLWVLAALGVLLGTAWAVVYTATPMVVDMLVPESRRAVAFGFATGSQQLGIGLGPIAGVGLYRTGVSLPAVFLTGAVLSGLGAVSVAVLHRLAPPYDVAAPDATAQLPLGRALREVLGSAAARPLLLILLSACLTFFQTTYAAAMALNSSIFYLSYTLGVLVARFGIGRALADRDPARVAAGSLTVLCVSVASFLLVGSNPIIYALASAGTGIGYGLSLPVLQAEAVALSSPGTRSRVLPLAGLLFETAILAFPVLAGTVIVGLGYQAVFVLLLGFALAQTAIAWTLPTRSAAPEAGASGQ